MVEILSVNKKNLQIFFLVIYHMHFFMLVLPFETVKANATERVNPKKTIGQFEKSESSKHFEIQCKNESLQEKFENAFLDEESKYLGVNSIGYQAFKQRNNRYLLALPLKNYDPKRAFFYDAKQEMLEHARFTILENLLESRKSIAIFGGIKGEPLKELPKSCLNLGKKWQADFHTWRDRDPELNEKVIANAHRIGPLSYTFHYKALVHESFKTIFYQDFLATNLWRNRKYVPKNLERFNFSFPQIVSENGKRVFAHQATESIYNKHPILRRVESGVPGIPLKQLDKYLFEVEFLGLHKNSSERFLETRKSSLKKETFFSEISNRVIELYQLLLDTNDDKFELKIRESLPPKDDYFFMSYEQRVFILAWEYFLEKELDAFIASKMLLMKSDQNNWQIPAASLFAIDKIYSKWLDEIHWTIEKVCSMERDSLQDLPGLPLMHFSKISEISDKEKETTRELAGYCSEPWKSDKTRQEDYLRAFSVPSVAVAIFLPGGAFLTSVYAYSAAVMASASFLNDAYFGVQKSRIKSALLNPGVSERLQGNFSNIYKAAMSAVLFHFSKKLVFGAREAVKLGTIWEHVNYFHWPFKDQAHFMAIYLGGNAIAGYRYLRSGENPFKRREFLVGFISGAIGNLALRPAFNQEGLAQAMSILMYFGTIVLVDETYQGFMSFLAPQDFDEKVAEFNMAWSGYLLADYLVLIRICQMIEKSIEGTNLASKHAIAVTFSTMVLLVRAYFVSNLQAGAQLRYFDDPTVTNPFEAMLSPRWSDFDPLDRSRNHSPDHSIFSPSLSEVFGTIGELDSEQQESLRELIKYYSTDVDLVPHQKDLVETLSLIRENI